MSWIFNRYDEKLFLKAIQISLRGYRESILKLFEDFVDAIDNHVQSLADNGDIVSLQDVN